MPPREDPHRQRGLSQLPINIMKTAPEIFGQRAEISGAKQCIVPIIAIYTKFTSFLSFIVI